MRGSPEQGGHGPENSWGLGGLSLNATALTPEPVCLGVFKDSPKLHLRLTSPGRGSRILEGQVLLSPVPGKDQPGYKCFQLESVSWGKCVKTETARKIVLLDFLLLMALQFSKALP